MTPDEAWNATPQEYATNPEVRQIRRVTAGGYGNLAVAMPGWETLEELPEEGRLALSKAFHRCILGPDGENAAYDLHKGDGLNRFDRNLFTEDDARYFAQNLHGLEVWFGGKKYVADQADR